MKSKLFKTRSIGLNENNVKFLETVSKMSDEALREIAKWINEEFEIVPRRLEAYYVKERVEKINDLCLGCGISEKDFFDVFSFTKSLIKIIYELDDNLSDVIDDIVSRKIIPVETKEKVLHFFQSTESKCIEIAKQSQKDNFETKSLPVLNNIDYSVHLRLVPKTPFEPDFVNIEDYHPEAEDLVLLSVIELITNDGKNKNVLSFQLNFTELEGLIVRLQACQKEMRLLQAYQEKHKIK